MKMAVQGEPGRSQGVVLGRYRVVYQLGQGGTSDVYLAVADGPRGFQKLVVLKVLKRCLSQDDELRAMFLGEAILAARLRHPHIVQTNEVLEQDGVPVMVMEYLDGQPLSQVIIRGKGGDFPLAMQLRLLVDALHGLHAAHELADFDGTPLGLVHRDVSPQNIFVTIEGEAKVLDFGIAKLERSLVHTEIGTVKGKLRYMAPEQIAGGRVDRRADIYSAGVMLWEALAGERMWKGVPEHEIRARVLSGDLPRSEGAGASASPRIERICRRALSLSLQDRHPSALALADELEETLTELGPPVSLRQIGAAVAALFEDVRAQTKAALERQLGTPSRSRPSSVALPAQSSSSSSPSSAAVSVQAAPPDRESRHGAGFRLAVVVVAAGLAVATTSWLGGTRDHGHSMIAGSPKAAPLPSIPVVPVTRQDRRPSVVQSSSALMALGLDGDTSINRGWTTTCPSERRISRGGRRHHGGHSPERPAPLAAPSATPNVGPVSNPPAAGPDCTHPFFVDGDGIKKFRSECR